jgi:CheY-like chemotaxis protein
MSSDRYTPEPLRPGRVLLVDDNALNLLVAREMLASLGSVVETADDGLQALEILERERFDLVFMDVHMPVLDGLAATQELRRRESAAQRPRTVVVALTANAMLGDRERCLAAGMDDYIAKPVRRDQLAAMLERFAPAGGTADNTPT